MSDLSKLIGERIINLRKEQRWNQEELAHRANISRTYMGSIERGETSATVDSLEKIADAFDITVEDMFKNLQPPAGNNGDTTLVLLLNKLKKLSVDNQKFVLDFVELFSNRKCK